MLFFEGFCRPRLRFQVRIDLRLVSMVVSQSSMNLRQRQMAELADDFLGNQAHVVPLSDPAN